MKTDRGTRLNDYAEFLASLNQQGLKPVVVGGHAVNVWAELFLAEEAGLAAYEPFVSKDLDLYRPDTPVLDYFRAKAFRVVEEKDPFSKAWTPVGTIFFLKSSDGRELTVDNLKSLNGLTEREVRDNVVPVQYGNTTIYVLNPIFAFKAKCHNHATIKRQGRQDDRHVRILCLCVRAFLRTLLAQATTSGKARLFLTPVEEVMELTRDRHIKDTSAALQLDLARLLPLAELRASAHPKIQTFVDKRLPQWLASIPPVTAASPGATSSPPAP